MALPCLLRKSNAVAGLCAEAWPRRRPSFVQAGFVGEVKAKYTAQMAEVFRETFCWLPLGYVINSKVLVVSWQRALREWGSMACSCCSGVICNPIPAPISHGDRRSLTRPIARRCMEAPLSRAAPAWTT